MANSFDAKFVADMRKMLKEGSPNDITFMTMNGEITANKDILSARSDYFATMFNGTNNSKFIEGQTKTIDMKHVEKVVMQTVIDYLFTGKLIFSQLQLKQQLCLIDLLRLYMLNEELESVKNHIMTQNNIFKTLDVIEGFILAKELKCPNDLIQSFVTRIQYDLSAMFPLAQICPSCKDKEKKNEHQTLETQALVKYPYNVFKKILLATNASIHISTKIRVFDVWFAANEDKLEAKEALDVFKDYREFVDRDISSTHLNCYQQNNSYSYSYGNQNQKCCSKCRTNFH